MAQTKKAVSDKLIEKLAKQLGDDFAHGYSIELFSEAILRLLSENLRNRSTTESRASRRS